MRARFRRWRHSAQRPFRPVRSRLTLLATTLVTLALAIAAVILTVALHEILLGQADAATRARATQIADIVRSDGIDGVEPELLAPTRNVDIIQIVDAQGRIRLSNQHPTGTPLGSPVAAGDQRVIDGAHTSPGGTEYRATLIGLATARDGALTVEVGASERVINWLVLVVALMCCIVFPVIVVGIAWLTYMLVGRALGPVEAIRQQVHDISGGTVDGRVPVPSTEDEIATLAQTMNGMLDRVEAARRQQVRFVNDASHELNSPLTTVVGLLDLAQHTRRPVDLSTVDTVLLPEAQRLQQMVADLVLLARVDEGGLQLHREPVDLDAVVSDEVNRVEALTGMSVEATVGVARVDGDHDKIVRAVRNVADNAVRHTRDRLAITMSVDDNRQVVRIDVADNGSGVPDQDKERVRERFVRLDSARQRSSGGSGLGLAIVDEIMRAHGGRLVIGDAPGGGTVVSLIFPLLP